MNPISHAWCCQIELTSRCPGRCLYCSRFTSHIRPDQHFDMTLEQLSNAFDTLEDWPKDIGIIGGEPTVHPMFEDVCNLVREKKGRHRVGLWTSGGYGYDKHRDLIKATFDFEAYNDHSNDECRHQPITMASKDMVPDERLRAYLIDNCWVQRIWCPTISPKGAFFCEVAYAIDHILDGPGGWPVEKGWWWRQPCDFSEQKWACQMCGMPVPQERVHPDCDTQKVSPSVLAEFMKRNLPWAKDRKLEVSSQTVTDEDVKKMIPEWTPGNYRPGMAMGGFK